MNYAVNYGLQLSLSCCCVHFMLIVLPNCAHRQTHVSRCKHGAIEQKIKPAHLNVTWDSYAY